MIFVILAAVLMYLAYPNCFALSGYSLFAWVAAVPLFLALNAERILGRVIYGGMFGVLFYSVLTQWFYVYNPGGHVFFVFMLTLQPVLFAVFFKSCFRLKVLQYFYLPFVWVLSEVLRSAMLKGFS